MTRDRAPASARATGGLSEAIAAATRQAAALGRTEHRPWPLPPGLWIMGQTWEDLLFAHWALPPDALRRHVPPVLPLDTFERRAWLGITPFRLRHLRLRATLPLPRVSSFPELNVRTYVTLDGKPGVFFFSLDAGSALAVRAARTLYRLPYRDARMSVIEAPAGIEYTSRRTERGYPPAEFKAFYGGEGEARESAPGSLEHFLTERYCLYTVDRGGVFRAEIHHEPWRLRPGRAAIELNTMWPPGPRLPADEPLLHLAERIDVLVWPLEAVS